MAQRNEKRIPVQFLVDDPPYNAGEIAGFNERKARALIADEIAVPHKVKTARRAVKKPTVDRAVKAPAVQKGE